jgi:type VI protein secretion system component VasK
MTETQQKLDPQRVAGVRRRIGFVALLWWIAAIFGSMGLAQGTHVGWARLLFIAIAWVLAILFTYAWWEAGRQSRAQ